MQLWQKSIPGEAPNERQDQKLGNRDHVSKMGHNQEGNEKSGTGQNRHYPLLTKSSPQNN